MFIKASVLDDRVITYLERCFLMNVEDRNDAAGRNIAVIETLTQFVENSFSRL
jgi:hypothetical protein